MQTYLELIKNQGQNQAEPWKKSPKARASDIYLGKSYIDSYYFCQQFEDYFDITSATGVKRTPFTVLFLQKLISY